MKKADGAATSFKLEPGQTVWKVSKDTGIPVSDILSANGNIPAERFRAGVPYKLPAAPNPTANPPVKANGISAPVTPAVKAPAKAPAKAPVAKSRGAASTGWDEHPVERKYPYGYVSCPHCGQKYGNPPAGSPASAKRMFIKERDAILRNHILMLHSGRKFNTAKELSDFLKSTRQ